MTIRYKCEECGSVLNIKDEKAGTQGRCPKCKAEFLIPSVEAAADASSDSSELVGAEPIYEGYHRALGEVSERVRRAWGQGLLLDIHGQGADADAITRQMRAIASLLVIQSCSSLNI